jgi:hypothetical protein
MTPWLLIIFLYGTRIDIIRVDTYEQCINRSLLVARDNNVIMALCEPDKGRDA